MQCKTKKSHQLLGVTTSGTSASKVREGKLLNKNVLTGHDEPHDGVEDGITRALLVLESRVPYWYQVTHPTDARTTI
jgi:hypothetical protein